MTKPLKLFIFISVATTLLLSSCSSKFNSRMEASFAKDRFLEGGKEFVVVWIPDDEGLQKAIESRVKEQKESCRRARDELYIRQNSGASQYIISLHEGYVKDECRELDTSGITKESTTDRSKYDTRTCIEEPLTRQFVCTERKIKGDEILFEDWLKHKRFHYTYFRY